MIEILSIIGLCWLTDYAKLMWHGVKSRSVIWIIAHFISAWFLLTLAVGDALSCSTTLAITFLLVLGHVYTIDAKSAGLWYGKLWSWLSSHPFQLLALGSLGWHFFWAAPLVGIGNLVMWMDLVRIYTANEKYRLRPKHWTESYWERFN
jgi:hypothetical protein